MRGLQPRWLLVATLAAVVVGIAVAVWLYDTLAAG
jgi:hypothetical protein